VYILNALVYNFTVYVTRYFRRLFQRIAETNNLIYAGAINTVVTPKQFNLIKKYERY